MTKLMMLATLMMCLGACGKAAPTKGSGAKTTDAAKSSGQKASPKVAAEKSKGTSSGASKDGVTCDASLEGVGFCATDTTVVFCTGGEWWALECSALDAASFCGVDDLGALDCWLATGE